MRPFALLAGLGSLGLFLYGTKKSGAATLAPSPFSPVPAPPVEPHASTPPATTYSPAPSPTSGATLREGMRGPAVAEWQNFLGITADGFFGPNTTSATKLFQTARGLKADGVVGPETRAAAHLASTEPPQAVTPVVTPVLTVPPSGYVAARPTPELTQVAEGTLAFGDPIGTSYPFEADGKKYLAVVILDGGTKRVAIYQPENQA